MCENKTEGDYRPYPTVSVNPLLTSLLSIIYKSNQVRRGGSGGTGKWRGGQKGTIV